MPCTFCTLIIDLLEGHVKSHCYSKCSAYISSPQPETYFQLLKWMHKRDNHFNLLEMDRVKVNQKG